MEKRFLAFVLAAFALVGALLFFFRTKTPVRKPAPAGGRTTSPLRPERTLAFRACVADSDCVYAQNGCCDCANGAQEIAVHRAQLASFQNHFACEHRACTEIAPSPPCGTGTVGCRAGLCEFQGPTR